MIDAAKSLGSNVGDTGWEVRVSDQTSSAEASYRTGYLTAKAGVAQNGGASSVGVQLRGSISALGGNVFFSDWIDNSFAVVDAGAPGVDVFYENRPVGKTDSEGMLLVPSLRPYQNNSIAVDPVNLPADMVVERTNQIVSPPDRAGVYQQHGRLRGNPGHFTGGPHPRPFSGVSP